MSKITDCLLCNDAKCNSACDKLDVSKTLRSLYFHNSRVVLNKLNDEIPCLSCDGKCKDACIVGVDIKQLISGISKTEYEKVDIDYECLKTDFCGIPVENPFFLSSSVVASTYDMCARAFDAGWGGVCFKTISLMDIHEASPRYSAISDNNERIIGFKNIEQLSDHSLPENIEIFRKLKENYPSKFLLISIMGRNEEEWEYLTKQVCESGADAIELNFSCPNMTENNTGSDVGQIPELVERYTRICKNASSIPVIAKLTPNVTNICEATDAAIRGGADGIAAINTIKSLIDIDIDASDGVDLSAPGGYSGKAVLPIALRFISEIAKDKNMENKHISAMGGIENWRDVIQFFVLGADSIQVTTSVMQYGYRIIEDIKDGVAYYLKTHNIDSIKQLSKTTLEGIVNTDQLERDYVIYPKFLRERCVGCQRCYVSCMDGGHQAISIKDGKPVLDPSRCVGCHLCVLVCPTKAIKSSNIKVKK